MLLNGVTLTIVGMVVVFIFLALLVFVMSLLFFLVKKLSPESLTERPEKGKQRSGQPEPAKTETAEAPAEVAPEIAVAIAAITAHITARG